MSRKSAANMYRRARKPNYTHDETLALLEQLDTHKHILFGKSTNHQRVEIWTAIQEAVNSVPDSAGRTIEELKHRWKDMSHRARCYARNLQKAQVNNTKPPAAATPYYDIIIKIMSDIAGTGLSELYDDPSPNDSLSSFPSVSKSTENSRSESLEQDIKPRFNWLNHLSSSHPSSLDAVSSNPNNREYNSHTDSNKTITSQPQFSVTTHPTNFSRFGGENLSQSAHASTSEIQSEKQPTPMARSAKRKRSNPSFTPTRLNQQYSHTPNATLVGRSKAHETQHQNQYYRYRPTESKPNPQPSASSQMMRLDPDTQEVMEMTELDLDSDTSEDGSESEHSRESKSGVNDYKRITQTKSANNNSHPSLKRHKLDHENMHRLSLEEVKKLYFIQKIKMISQRRNCFKLLERKLACELKILESEAAKSTNPAFFHSSRVPSRALSDQNYTGDCPAENQDCMVENELDNGCVEYDLQEKSSPSPNENDSISDDNDDHNNDPCSSHDSVSNNGFDSREERDLANGEMCTVEINHFEDSDDNGTNEAENRHQALPEMV